MLETTTYLAEVFSRTHQPAPPFSGYVTRGKRQAEHGWLLGALCWPGHAHACRLLTHACLAAHRIVQMLLPVTSRTRVRRSGISPLHLAAERNHDAVLEALLAARFDVNAPLAPERSRLYEDRRSSALYFAVVNNNVYATELLLLAGADPNRDVISPLLVAIRHGCLRTMQLLLDHGANIDAYIATHPTAFPATIMFAMKCLSLLKFLMDLGCDGEPCFSCLYGNGPHPPAQRLGRFHDAPVDDKAPSVVQVHGGRG